MRIMHHHDHLQSNRMAMTQPVHPIVPPSRQHFAASLPAALHDSGTSWVAGKHRGGVPGAHEMRVILKEPHPRAA